MLEGAMAKKTVVRSMRILMRALVVTVDSI